MLEILYEKRPDISYDLLCVVYFVAVVLCVLFYTMEYMLNIPSVEGYWIVLSPFFPCLIWGLFMRNKTGRLPEDTKDKKEK